ncbi:MAG: hypothetical protein CVV42_15270 [Candidatus Riflebacteria bacterium HGW-Riflebacteria-2]|jgi:hypothetical protein|nr:MAG: hypothetical protein CVV42_15270 [Candidatus Riflebacteria bacterium HGW-Riflebacteria-2]
MKPNCLKVMSIAVVFLLAGSGNAFAWGSRVHMKIVSDAYHIMPQAFRDFLGESKKPTLKQPALKPLMEASVEPDRVLKDFQNHIFHIQASSMGKGPFHIESLIEEVGLAIAKKKSRSEIIQKLGWIGHYTADLAQPLHTGSSLDDTIEEKSYHSATEKDADKWVLTYGVNFDGCDDVKRISARMIYEALWANQHYDALEYAYTKGKRYAEARTVMASCYSRAVNNVVDMWYAAWVKGGGKVLPSDKKPKYFPPVKKFHFVE